MRLRGEVRLSLDVRRRRRLRRSGRRILHGRPERERVHLRGSGRRPSSDGLRSDLRSVPRRRGDLSRERKLHRLARRLRESPVGPVPRELDVRVGRGVPAGAPLVRGSISGYGILPVRGLHARRGLRTQGYGGVHSRFRFFFRGRRFRFFGFAGLCARIRFGRQEGHALGLESSRLQGKKCRHCNSCHLAWCHGCRARHTCMAVEQANSNAPWYKHDNTIDLQHSLTIDTVANE
mmetsp:Transcript_4301/g.11989  ORF Transcript_4301/g.11989 Transcript_4301/m.11989 type:complete len:234 (-) Transcript_4301:265-966(-)